MSSQNAQSRAARVAARITHIRNQVREIMDIYNLVFGEFVLARAALTNSGYCQVTTQMGDLTEEMIMLIEHLQQKQYWMDVTWSEASELDRWWKDLALLEIETVERERGEKQRADTA